MKFDDNLIIRSKKGSHKRKTAQFLGCAVVDYRTVRLRTMRINRIKTSSVFIVIRLTTIDYRWFTEKPAFGAQLKRKGFSFYKF